MKVIENNCEVTVYVKCKWTPVTSMTVDGQVILDR